MKHTHTYEHTIVSILESFLQISNWDPTSLNYKKKRILTRIENYMKITI